MYHKLVTYHSNNLIKKDGENIISEKATYHRLQTTNTFLSTQLYILSSYVYTESKNEINSICSVMVSTPSYVVDHRFEPRSGQTKYYEIGMCYISAKHHEFKEKEQRWVGSESA